jgi:hypothetical protein
MVFLLHLLRHTEIERKLLVRGRRLPGERFPDVYMWIIQLRGS